MITNKKISVVSSPLVALRRFAQRRDESEHCALCHAGLGEEHPHLFELASRRLQCACEACAVLFSNAAAPRYRRVPRDIRLLRDFRITDPQWEAFDLPIKLAFFVHSAAAQKLAAYYPSAGGAIEAQPPPQAWDELAAENDCLRAMEPDVEALLANRLGDEAQYYLLGIDHCFALAGVVRTHWRGFSGGATVWTEISTFFETLKARSTPEGAGRHA